MDRTQIRSGLVVVVTMAFGAGERVAIVQRDRIGPGTVSVRMWLKHSREWSAKTFVQEASIVRAATKADMQPIEDAAGGDWVWSEGSDKDTSSAGIAEGRGNS